MRITSKLLLTAALAAVTFSSIAMTGDDNRNIAESVAKFFGRTHVAVGGATLEMLPDGLRVIPSSTGESGIEIPVLDIQNGSQQMLNVSFDPILIEVGHSFTSDVVDTKGKSLITTRFEQISSTETNVYLVLDESVVDIDNVRLATFEGDELTSERFIKAQRESFIGTVVSTEQAWAKTYHWTCDEYGCLKSWDPANTTIKFADNPSVEVPFLYLAFDFPKNDIIRNAAAIRMSGHAEIVLRNENNDVLSIAR